MDENILFAFVPIIISLVLTLIFITPNLRFAVFAKGYITGIIFSCLLSAIFLSVIAGVTLNYITNSSAQIISLKNVTDIEKSALNRFYRINSINVDLHHTNHTYQYTGKYNDRLALDLVIPIADSFNRQSEYSYWILEQRDRFIGRYGMPPGFAYNSIINEMNTYLDTVDYTGVAYFKLETNTQKVKSIINEIIGPHSKKIILLRPFRAPIEERIKKDFLLTIITFFGLNLAWLAISIGLPINNSKLYKYKKGQV